MGPGGNIHKRNHATIYLDIPWREFINHLWNIKGTSLQFFKAATYFSKICVCYEKYEISIFAYIYLKDIVLSSVWLFLIHLLIAAMAGSKSNHVTPTSIHYNKFQRAIVVKDKIILPTCKHTGHINYLACSIWGTMLKTIREFRSMSLQLFKTTVLGKDLAPLHECHIGSYAAALKSCKQGSQYHHRIIVS